MHSNLQVRSTLDSKIGRDIDAARALLIACQNDESAATAARLLQAAAENAKRLSVLLRERDGVA